MADRDKANILIGPYGKGKSHLLLVLLALLNDGKGDRTKKTINKIENIQRIIMQKKMKKYQKLSKKIIKMKAMERKLKRKKRD